MTNSELWMIEILDHYLQLANKWRGYGKLFFHYEKDEGIIYLLRGNDYNSADCIKTFRNPEEIIPFLHGNTETFREMKYKAKGNVTN